MKQYTRMSLEERENIYAWQCEGVSKKEMGRRLGRATSSISREMDCCQADSIGYLPDRAHRQAAERQARNPKLFRSEALCSYVIAQMKECLSPEQIAGRMKLEKHDLAVSHETIYQYIYSEEGQAQKLCQLLPRRKPKRSNRMGRKPKKSHIPESACISNRPEHSEKREEFGHFEGDLVVFGVHHGANVTTLVERKSRYAFLHKNPNKYTENVVGGIKQCYVSLPEGIVKSTTFDRGTEFASYRKLGVDTYSCNPHSPWQKVSNENFNGRLRRYLPKNYNSSILSQELLDNIAHKMNNQPRKCLGFKTPAEVFHSHLYRGLR